MRRHRLNIFGLWLVVALQLFIAFIAGREAVRGFSHQEVTAAARGRHPPIKKALDLSGYWTSMATWLFIASVTVTCAGYVAFTIRKLK